MEKIPLYYRVAGTPTELQALLILDALRIHPLDAAIFHELKNADMAFRLSNVVFQVLEAAEAMKKARALSDLALVSAIVGGDDLLVAVYDDETTEDLLLYGQKKQN